MQIPISPAILLKACCWRIGEELADGDREVVTFAFEPDPFPIELRDEIGGGDDGVMPVCARHRAGMAIFTEDARVTITEAAADACHERNRNVAAGQHRSLFDMQLDIAAQVLGRPPRLDRARRLPD